MSRTSYLKELGKEHMARTFGRLQKLRNGINYYGEAVSKKRRKPRQRTLKPS